MQVHCPKIGSTWLGLLFLTFPTRVLTGQHVISSGAYGTKRNAAECLIHSRLPRWATHPVFIGFVFAHVSSAVCVTIPTLALKMISRVRCIEPNDGIRRAMLLRLLLGLKHHHAGTERRADSQENPEHRNQRGTDSPHHRLPPVLQNCSANRGQGKKATRAGKFTRHFAERHRPATLRLSVETPHHLDI